MSELKFQLLEFFDLETDSAARTPVRRLEVGSSCLAAGAETTLERPALLQVVEQGLQLIDQTNQLSMAGEAFLVNALRFAVVAGEADTHVLVYRFASSWIDRRATPELAAALVASALRLGDTERAKRLLGEVRNGRAANELRLKLARLEGRLDDASRLLTDQNAWEGALTRSIAFREQAPLVDYFATLSEEAAVEQRLVAFLIGNLFGDKGLHHRLQTASAIERTKVKRRAASTSLVALVDACLALERFPHGKGTFESLKWCERLVADAAHVADRETELITLCVGVKVAQKHGDRAAASALEQQYFTRARVTGEVAPFDPLQLLKPTKLPSTSKLPRALALPFFALRHALAARKERMDPNDNMEAYALRAWAQFLKGEGAFRGFLQKSAQFSVALAGTLSKTRDFKLEEAFFTGCPLGEAETREAVERYGFDYGKIPYLAPLPFASGSLGQVHDARLADGTEVVVKLRYPDIERRIRHDSSRARSSAELLSHVADTSDLTSMIEVFARLCQSQADFEQEAKNQATARMLTRHLSDVRVPEVHAACSSANFLVQEKARGVTLYQFTEFATQEEKNRAGIAIFRFFMTLIEGGLYYFDLHPGNVLFDDGKVWILDFGAILPKGNGIAENERTCRILKSGDLAAFEQLMIESGYLVPGRPRDLEALFRRCRDIHFRPFMTQAVFRFDHEYVQTILNAMRTEDRRDGVVVPKTDTLAGLRFFLSFYSLLAQLNAEANWAAIYEEILEHQRSRSAA